MTREQAERAARRICDELRLVGPGTIQWLADLILSEAQDDHEIAKLKDDLNGRECWRCGYRISGSAWESLSRYAMPGGVRCPGCHGRVGDWGRHRVKELEEELLKRGSELCEMRYRAEKAEEKLAAVSEAQPEPERVAASREPERRTEAGDAWKRATEKEMYTQSDLDEAVAAARSEGMEEAAKIAESFQSANPDSSLPVQIAVAIRARKGEHNG